LLHEMGPIMLDKTKRTLYVNNYTWSQKYSYSMDV
uniref:Phospholipase B-like n=1 Tax=Gongylonema pulchrum TaxID=637853 RepID=A0A183DCN2_9BILA